MSTLDDFLNGRGEFATPKQAEATPTCFSCGAPATADVTITDEGAGSSSKMHLCDPCVRDMMAEVPWTYEASEAE